MSRTTIVVNCNNPQQAQGVIQSILASENYELKEKNGEYFYQNGVGLLVAPKFISYSFNGNTLTLQGWVRNFAIGGESKLTGVIGALPKKQCKGVMDRIVNSIDGNILNSM